MPATEMNALEYARKNIYLWQSSPVSGKWDESRYPFVIEPLLNLDNIDCKVQVVYGPTQSFKTVFLQVATAYRLDMRRKSLLAVAQTDDDAKDFSRVKLIPTIERIPSLRDTTKAGKSSQTIMLWSWASHELIISGPGENAQQSKSVCYVHTDEAHRYCIDHPGAMAALNDRMGSRWDRAELHVTTAANAGTEIDIKYHKGRQNEWHLRCIHCNEMIWPLWTETSRAHYNGHQVFQWIDSQSETETFDSIHIVCPHCDKQISETPHNRIDMDSGAKYIPMNPDADHSHESFRWNALAPRWKPWREMLSIYLSAIHSAKLGNLAPYENWVKKQEVRSWTGEYPMLGDSTKGRTYSLGEIDIEVVREETFRTLSADQQESGGFHLMCQVDEWERNGNSKRLFYDRVETYADMKALELKYKVANRGKSIATAIDCGQGIREREIFAACSMNKWLALKSSDAVEFAHQILQPGQQSKIINHPYSTARLESSLIGKKSEQGISFRGGGVPPGYCISRTWSKPTIYGILYALKNGETGREYAIATDINPDYIKQLHSYAPSIGKDKKTNVPLAPSWVKVAPHDHAFITSCQSLLLAIIAGYFPLEKI